METALWKVGWNGRGKVRGWHRRGGCGGERLERGEHWGQLRDSVTETESQGDSSAVGAANRNDRARLRRTSSLTFNLQIFKAFGEPGKCVLAERRGGVPG